MKRIYLFLYARLLLAYFFGLTILLLVGLILFGIVAPDNAMELWCRFCSKFYGPETPQPVAPEQPPTRAAIKIEICPN